MRSTTSNGFDGHLIIYLVLMQHGLLDHRSRTLVGGKYYTNNDQTNQHTFIMLHTMFTNVMASSSTLLPGATVYAAREWDFNFQFTILRFSNYFNLGLLFQSQSQSQSHLRTGGVSEDLDFGTHIM